MLSKQCSLFSFALASLELTLHLFNIWNSIREAFFTAHICLLFVICAKEQMTELNVSLKKQVQNFRLSGLHFFYQEYWSMLSFARHMNDLVISKLYFSIFVSNISVNIVMISNLLFQNLSIIEKLIMLVIISLQTILILFSSFGLSAWSSCFYQSNGLLYKVQLGLATNKKNVRLYKRALVITTKLKLMTFYEQVCTRKEFCFTMGCLGKISHKSLYEFALMYSCMILYVSKMVRFGKL